MLKNWRKQLALLTLLLSGTIVGCTADNTTETTSQEETTTISGVVVDGYLKNAKVCIDINDNKKCDSEEPTATTEEGGRYTLNVSADLVNEYPVIAEIIAGQTIDEDTNQPVDKYIILQAPPEKPDVISPLSTLVATEIEENPALTLEQAELKVKNKMGVSSDVSILDDYIKTGNETLHEVAKVVTEVMGEILDNVEGQVSDEERDALLVVVTDTVKENLPTIVQTVEETLTTDNETSTENATLDVDEIVSQITSQVNATEILNDVKELDQQLEVVEDAEVYSDVLSLVGKKLYSMDNVNGQVYVNVTIINTDSEKDYRLPINELSSLQDVFTGELDGNASVSIEDGKIIIHNSDGDIRIDSIAVVDLAGKTLKASQVFKNGEEGLKDAGLSDFDITFNSGKEYILSLTGLEQDSDFVMAFIRFDEDAMEQIVGAFKNVLSTNSTTSTTSTDDTTADTSTTETTTVDTSYSIPSDAVETTYDELIGKNLYLPEIDNYQIEISVTNFFATDILETSENDTLVSNISSLSELSTDTTCTVSFVNETYEIQCPDDNEPAKISKIEKLDLTDRTINLFGEDFTFNSGTVYYLTLEVTDEEGNPRINVLQVFDETAMNDLLPQLQTLQEEINIQLQSLFNTISGTVTFEDPSVWTSTSNLKIRITPDVEQVDGDWGGVVCTINQDGSFGNDCVLHGDIANYTSNHTYQVVIFEDTDGDYRYDSDENSIWGESNLSLDEVKNIDDII